ncbi:GNAT family N-acetyltransferase [Massilibacterium senegalense]|uniref:GNAT family N-acetyltransferase n=1 Tax=Massilibacterium senegalense TaxID=1632858 RepID=UPI000784EC87|nr:GNAT family N-acetyltransferase [Massilibacterium senegalense]
MITKVVQTPKEQEDAFFIRKVVFIKEQHVPTDLEYDEFEQTAVHFVTYDGDKPVGAGRLRFVDGMAKVERICILPSYRGKNVGRHLMETIEQEAQQKGYNTFKLNAQVQAMPFYEKLGYTNISKETFMDAGIPHVEMRKSV